MWYPHSAVSLSSLVSAAWGGAGRCRLESTKPTELRFKALLTEGDARVRFYREGFDGFATPSP
jgi:hypothetical protein